VQLPNFGRGTGQARASSVACGNEFSAVLAEDGGVWTFGVQQHIIIIIIIIIQCRLYKLGSGAESSGN
jgi:alpha-tubulin suppressor-like RCC1 family protein